MQVLLRRLMRWTYRVEASILRWLLQWQNLLAVTGGYGVAKSGSVMLGTSDVWEVRMTSSLRRAQGGASVPITLCGWGEQEESQKVPGAVQALARRYRYRRPDTFG